MLNSFYVQVSPYLLLEYTYGDNTTTYVSSQVKLARIKNDYLGGQCQLLNGSASGNVTQNVLDNSAANLGGYKWAFLDKDVPVPYITQDPKLVYTDLSSLLPSLFVTYDRVRMHILSGYRLEDLEGFIVQVYGREAMSGKNSVLANNVYLNSDSRDILNPRPILMGDRMYDRFVEVYIPSLKGINQDFFANPTNPISIGYQYTSDNKGFLFNSAIYVKVYEINTTEKKNGNLFLYTSNVYEVSLNQEDAFSALTANVYEATDGDYFLYFPTYAGNFVEDFISDLNSGGGSYVIINDINVYEQVGLDNLLTFSFSQVQLDGFDAPLEFRPILKYAGSAVTFSVEYTVRIFNRSNGFQIIRRASTTSFNPRKYGKQLEKIALAQQSYPFKVYNKVYGNSPVNVIANDYSPMFSTVYVPVFYENRNVVVQNKTLLANGTNPISTDFYSNVNFGQGEARIYLSDFETYFKFVISQVDTKTGAISPLDLSAGNVTINFKDSAGNIFNYPALPSDDQNSKAKGEIVFKLPGSTRAKVLNTDEVKTFYIASSSPGAAETLIYSGTVDKVENISKEPARAQEIVTAAASSSTGTNANENVSTTSPASTTSSANTVSPTLQPMTLGPNKSILQQLTEVNSVSVDSVKSTPETAAVVIPGFSVDQRAVSIKNALTPVSLTKESASQAEVLKNLSKTGSSTTLKK
jgi:hypothetical protein